MASKKADTKALDNTAIAVAKLKEYIAPLTRTTREEIMEKVTPQEQAKLNTALAYSMCSLFYMYLKTQGAPVRGHPVQDQLKRVQGYFKQLKNVTEGKPKDYLGQRKLKVDQNAVNRFVFAGLQRNQEMKGRTARKLNDNPKNDQADDSGGADDNGEHNMQTCKKNEGKKRKLAAVSLLDAQKHAAAGGDANNIPPTNSFFSSEKNTTADKITTNKRNKSMSNQDDDNSNNAAFSQQQSSPKRSKSTDNGDKKKADKKKKRGNKKGASDFF
uniref:Nuclear nucleic acid-binding protein C1D n=1 Tax=Heterosigma akashiwo TaxID=2829 RepID=A0A7S3XPB2_HETAK|mmetsp:Transcript_31083/g.53700  ORF Transcript_31083/g.53700 Transcript_31083/m.53700 type:complete len:271 (+) Transcript_31083:45-857(+)